MDTIKTEWKDWGRRQWVPWGSPWNWTVEGIWFHVNMLVGRLSGTRCYGFWYRISCHAFWKAYYPMRLWK